MFYKCLYFNQDKKIRLPVVSLSLFLDSVLVDASEIC